MATKMGNNAALESPDGSSVSAPESARLRDEGSPPVQNSGGRRRSTGPRTPSGKERSKFNARTHGIFADVVFEDRESREEFKKLVELLSTDVQPQGPLEEILVADLAMTVWKKKRLLRAEKQAVQTGPLKEYLEAQQSDQAEDQAWANSEEAREVGLISRQSKPLILTRCIRLLRFLLHCVQTRGFVPEDDRVMLRIVYGQRAMIVEDLAFFYEQCSAASRGRGRESATSEGSEAEDPRQLFIRRLEREISLLEEGFKVGEVKLLAHVQLMAATLLPSPERAELFLRYWASLDRRWERILGQLLALRGPKSERGERVVTSKKGDP